MRMHIGKRDFKKLLPNISTAAILSSMISALMAMSRMVMVVMLMAMAVAMAVAVAMFLLAGIIHEIVMNARTITIIMVTVVMDLISVIAIGLHMINTEKIMIMMLVMFMAMVLVMFMAMLM